MKLKLSLSIGFTASLLLISPTLAGEIVIIRGVGSTNVINNNAVRQNNFTNFNRIVVYPEIYSNSPNIIYQNNSSATYTGGLNYINPNNINGSYTRTINPFGQINNNFNNGSSNISRQIIRQEVSTENTVTIVNLNNNNLATQPLTPTPVTSIGNIRQNTIIRSDSFKSISKSEILRTLRGFN